MNAFTSFSSSFLNDRQSVDYETATVCSRVSIFVYLFFVHIIFVFLVHLFIHLFFHIVIMSCLPDAY